VTSISEKNGLSSHKNYRLAVLLVTPNTSDTSGPVVIGGAKPSLKNAEFVHYAELLSASNFAFDIIKPEEISHELFFENNIVKYVAIIITCPLSSLSDAQFSVLKQISHQYGVSVIAAYSQVDERSKPLFGIRSFRGKAYLWPLKVKIIRWPKDICETETVVDYGLGSGFTGYRKGGLHKLSVKQTLIKGTKHLRGLLLPYVKVQLEPKTRILATNMNGKQIAWSYQFGAANNYYFALHGAFLLGKFNEMHQLYRAVIEANSGHGMASVDLTGTMVLRLDDPGACLADYLSSDGILDEHDWKDLGRFLENRRIPVSVLYTPAWVDDGDITAGTLFVGNRKVKNRTAGTLFDSHQVRYLPSNSKKKTYDHSSEFKGLQKLVKAGYVDVHSHGLTHLNPDYQAWSQASDRRANYNWYHEFFDVPRNKGINKDVQLQAMASSREKVKNLFGVLPCALTPSGHKHDENSDLLALDAGYSLFSSDYTGIIKRNRLIRNSKIPSLFVFFKQPSPFAAKSGYPIVGVIHDYEIKKKGHDSLWQVIEAWRAKGVDRFISMTQLAASLCISIDAQYEEKESKLSFTINLPRGTEIIPPVSKRSEVDVILRAALPEDMRLLRDNTFCSGAKLVSLEHSSQNGAAKLFIKFNDAQTTEVSLDMNLSKLYD
jgi:hypothetical protein